MVGRIIGASLASVSHPIKEPLCDALLIINDDADIAAACGAQGLHVGQTDLPIADARRILAPTQLIGRSNNGVEDALDSQRQGADYIAVGAVFPTPRWARAAGHP